MSGIPWLDALAYGPSPTSPLDRPGSLLAATDAQTSELAAGFAQQLNRRFLIQFEDEWVASELVEVQDRSVALTDASPVQLESVSLLFRGPADATFGQGIYKVQNRALGTQELFLVPVGPGDEVVYEAVFNRIVG